MGWRWRQSRATRSIRRPVSTTLWSNGTCCGRSPTRPPRWPHGTRPRLLAGWSSSRAAGASGNGTRLDKLRNRARELADQVRRAEPGHHGHYTAQLNAALPYSAGLTPADAVSLVRASPWGAARIERLRAVEWAITDGKGLLDTLLGTHARWAVIAGS